MDAALDKLAAGPDPVFMSPAEKKQALVEISRQSERLTALRHQILAVATDAADAEAARSVAALAAHHTRRDYHRTAAEARLAVALDQRWHRTRAAWATGRINRDQVTVIVDALDKLPDWVTPDQRASAEEHLITLAEQWPPHALRTLATHLWEVIAPEEAEQLEADALAAAEANARAATRLTLRRVGDGSTRITGRIPDHVAQRLNTLLDAHTSPRRLASHGLPEAGTRVAATRPTPPARARRCSTATPPPANDYAPTGSAAWPSAACSNTPTPPSCPNTAPPPPR
jgi:hypothetical protein